MTTGPLISQQVKSANKFLYAVKTYLDLISRSDQLVAGSGLKRLYSMSSGVATLNDQDIEAITAKAEKEGLLPYNLDGFLIACVLKNIELYGRELHRIIQSRVIGIGNGDIVNPPAAIAYSPEEGRRYYYTPPAHFVKRLQKALNDDMGYDFVRTNSPVVTRIQDVANDAEIMLTQMQINEGYSSPNETSWGALMGCVERLVELLAQESLYPTVHQDYKKRARGALKILWVIAKLIQGDLTIKPAHKDVNLIDLDQKINLSDGTLAAIPFPLKETIALFSDEDNRGMTLKARFYLSALSAAAFYRGESC